MKKTVEVFDSIFEEIFSYEEIIKRISELSNDLNNLKIENPVFLIVLKGAFLFGSELIKRYDNDCAIHFIQTSSYKGMNSTDNFQFKSGLKKEDLTNKDLILVEDIVDTGRTIKEIKKELNQYEYNSLQLISLIDKPEARKFEITVDHCGFTIPNKFIIGFGLDYDEVARNYTSLYLKK